MAPEPTADDIVSPGHVFPLITLQVACTSALLRQRLRSNCTSRAGAGDAAVICAIMRDDGEMARPADIADLVERFGLAVADIDDLLAMPNAGSDA